MNIHPKFALGLLLIERQKLMDEQAAMIAEYNQKINEIEAAIEMIEGKKVWKEAPPTLYDDESPNYIKSSIED